MALVSLTQSVSQVIQLRPLSVYMEFILHMLLPEPLCARHEKYDNIWLRFMASWIFGKALSKLCVTSYQELFAPRVCHVKYGYSNYHLAYNAGIG